jgi:hypothetical protein
MTRRGGRVQPQAPAGPAREKALTKLGADGRKRIERAIPALGELRKAVKDVARGRSKQLRSHDGRMLNIRAQHSALNTLLQGGGAVVMKKALVLAYDAFLARGWQHGREFAFVANVHDEFQMEVMPEYATESARLRPMPSVSPVRRSTSAARSPGRGRRPDLGGHALGRIETPAT